MVSTHSMALVAVASLLLTATAVSAQKVDVWFGTNTPAGGESRGIYHSALDVATGKMTPPTLAAETRSPGFLALHPNGKVLYATGSPASEGGRSGGEVSAFRVSGAAGQAQLEFIGAAETGDGGAAHIATDHAGRVLLSAQYGGGSTSLYRLADDGSIAALADMRKHAELLPQAGSGVVDRRQDSPHAHWAGTSPDDRFAFVPDLGMDRVVIWKLDAEKPTLSPHGFGVCPPGSGPRHMKFSHDQKRVFVLNELSLSVTVFDYDAEHGKMTPVQTIETLSEETKAKERFNSASEIRVHPSGKFVYTGNRGHDSITAFRSDENGRLSLIEIEPIRGAEPRNFNIDPSGKWLIAAGQNSSSASVFEIDPDSGELTFIRETHSVPTPICVLFGAI